MEAFHDEIREIEERSGRTTLRPVDIAFFAAIDGPPQPTDRLRASFARHAQTVASR
ncbi:hypothetical protein [Mesorhizobium sp. WSM4906]|uniref:hypothetical protein n=1 Tax=Mesorhizobium sp. WSM4906 TaxID=3038546 RepID=UPI0024175395|nr:hypothetical protein [Mesorhizobium sp. WSM4906]WFP74557.1 hypothetical protein QAZ22_22815 [Mesorhizobium sp. WSM4906]